MPVVISLVSYPFLPAKLGGQKGIALFNQYFAKHTRLVCITTQKNQPAAAEGYEVINSISNSKLRYINVFLFFRIRRLIKKEQATHLLLEHPYYGWLGILLKWFTPVKLVIHSHNIEAQRWKTLGRWWWPVLFSYEKMTHRAAHYNFFIREEDRLFAIEQFGLQPTRAATITYGIDWDAPPTALEKLQYKLKLQQIHGIKPKTTIFLFNGTLDYGPNLDAVKTILDDINPRLVQTQKQYKIIICGKGLPSGMRELKDYAHQHIVYAGFVDDISLYFKGCDVFINPVIDGGGIKTKLVEALGYNLDVISSFSGATGVPATITGNKMKIVADNDWQGFADHMLEPLEPGIIPLAFFDHFYWKNIAAKAYAFIR